MKTTLLKFAALLAIASASIHAQPSRASMEKIKMPAPHFDFVDNLSSPGDWGYWTVGSLRQLSNTANLGDPRLWNWVRYTNTGNAKEVWASAGMADNACNHAHLSYGLWGKYTMNIAGIQSSAWTRIGMGTQSGEMINGRCKWDVDNSWGGEDFGWGTNYMTGNFRNFPFKFTEFVVGILGMSHVGHCGVQQCGHRVTSYLWTLP